MVAETEDRAPDRAETAGTHHAFALAQRIREADALECHRSMGVKPIDAIMDGVHKSREAWAFYLNDELACMYGVVDGRGPMFKLLRKAMKKLGHTNPKIGVAWMLTSDTVDRLPIKFFKYSRGHLAELFDRWTLLVNYVDADNEQAIRWLTRLGAQISDPMPMGPFENNFRQFMISAKMLTNAQGKG